LPFREASAEYRRNFFRAMNLVHVDDVTVSGRMTKMLQAQTLWDSTMAFSIEESFETVDLVSML
jgi:hypothetical protein